MRVGPFLTNSSPTGASAKRLGSHSRSSTVLDAPPAPIQKHRPPLQPPIPQANLLTETSSPSARHLVTLSLFGAALVLERYATITLITSYMPRFILLLIIRSLPGPNLPYSSIPSFFFLMIRRPPKSTLFPYTPLFR